MAAAAAGKANSKPGEWADEVISLEKLTALLVRFGMIVGLDASPEPDGACGPPAGRGATRARYPGPTGMSGAFTRVVHPRRPNKVGSVRSLFGSGRTPVFRTPPEPVLAGQLLAVFGGWDAGGSSDD